MGSEVLLSNSFHLEIINFIKSHAVLQGFHLGSKKAEIERLELWRQFAAERSLTVEECKRAWKSIRDKFSSRMRRNVWSHDTIQNDSILYFLYELHSVQMAKSRKSKLPTEAENLLNCNIKNKVKSTDTNIVHSFVNQSLNIQKIESINKKREMQPSSIVTQDVIDQLLEARNDKERIQTDPQNLKSDLTFNPIKIEHNFRNVTDSRRVFTFDLTENSNSNDSGAETVVAVYTHKKYPENLQNDLEAIDKFKGDTIETDVTENEPDIILKRLLKRKLEAGKETDLPKKTTRSCFSNNVQKYVKNIVSEINDLENSLENIQHQNIESSEEKSPPEKAIDVKKELINGKSEMNDEYGSSEPENCQNRNLEIDRTRSLPEKITGTVDSLYIDEDLNDIISEIDDILISNNEPIGSNTITLYGEGSSTVIQLPGLNNSLRLTRRMSEESTSKPKSLLRHYDLTTKEFFSEIGKYINKKFTSQKQQDLRLQIRSMLNNVILEERAAGTY